MYWEKINLEEFDSMLFCCLNTEFYLYITEDGDICSKCKVCGKTMDVKHIDNSKVDKNNEQVKNIHIDGFYLNTKYYKIV